MVCINYICWGSRWGGWGGSGDGNDFLITKLSRLPDETFHQPSNSLHLHSEDTGDCLVGRGGGDIVSVV